MSTTAPASPTPGSNIPQWRLAGSHPTAYEATVDPTVLRQGKPAARLRAKPGAAEGFGTLMQAVQPGEFRDHRVRLGGWLRAAQVGQWAGLWMRVDGPNGEVLAFDNMADRPVSGDRDWTEAAVVLPVSAQAVALSFGLLLCGDSGAVWLSGLTVERVEETVPVTAAARPQPARPMNLDFAQTPSPGEGA